MFINRLPFLSGLATIYLLCNDHFALQSTIAVCMRLGSRKGTRLHTAVVDALCTTRLHEDTLARP